MITIILVEPEGPENIGAVARSMQNFNINKLVLVNPKTKHLGMDARRRAMKAFSVLQKAKVTKTIPKIHTLIGTTARLGTDYNVARVPFTPEQVAEKIKNLPARTNIGIVFGRESKGLTNEELQQCDFTITIPSSEKYSSLNLSHAVSLVLYEIYKAKNEKGYTKKMQEKFTLASAKEKEQLMKLHKEVLNTLQFTLPSKKETQVKVWKRMISKAFLTKREAYALMGFLKKLKEKSHK